jgi:hypothetical protein
MTRYARFKRINTSRHYSPLILELLACPSVCLVMQYFQLLRGNGSNQINSNQLAEDRSQNKTKDYGVSQGISDPKSKLKAPPRVL